ncbi:hypothetical protein CCHR01_02918 [Colletotrichum chrysophilum]|uniref:Uncharacterized protein n=1 Tax=Colletotrichum chrysophilum TaxID=1836956 RepID=A0AAD9EP06_9PEZI|nr:hypothetical protein CCHR01_02918 [Colletotrichum chrysophilum]
MACLQLVVIDSAALSGQLSVAMQVFGYGQVTAPRCRNVLAKWHRCRRSSFASLHLLEKDSHGQIMAPIGTRDFLPAASDAGDHQRSQEMPRANPLARSFLMFPRLSLRFSDSEDDGGRKEHSEARGKG